MDGLTSLHSGVIKSEGRGPKLSLIQKAHGYVGGRGRKGLGEVRVYGMLSWGRWVNREFWREKALWVC
nr:hypothetical protein [Tanacetum cinerariifolium]